MTDYLKIARQALVKHREQNQPSTVACPPAPPKPTEEPTFGGFGGAGASLFSITKGSGSPSDGLSPTSESVDRSQQAPESGGQETTGADSASGLLPIIPTIEPSAPQPEDDWEDL
jgi:hypothetical protein